MIPASNRSGTDSGALFFGDSIRMGQGVSRAGERVFVIQAKDSTGAYRTVLAVCNGALYIDGTSNASADFDALGWNFARL